MKQRDHRGITFKLSIISLVFYLPIFRAFLAHLSRRLKWTIVIARRPSSVRPSSVVVVRKLFKFSTSSPEPLDRFWWNLVGMKYSWSLTSVVVFRPDPPGADPGRGQNRSLGSPSSTNFFFRPEDYSDKPNGWQWSRSMWEEVLLLLVPFRSQIFDAFLTSFGLRHIALF